MPLLDMMRTVCDELSLPRLATVVNNPDQQARTLLSHAHSAGEELLSAHDWTMLTLEATCSTVSGQHTYLMASCNASSFQRFPSDTFWDRTGGLQMIGPDNPQIDKFLRESGTAQSSIRYRWRPVYNFGGGIKIFPTPTSNVLLVFDYIDRRWVLNGAFTSKASVFQLDTDTTVFNEFLMAKSVKWRYMAGKGMDASALKAEYDEKLAAQIAADTGGSKMNMEPQEYSEISDPVVADGNWSL